MPLNGKMGQLFCKSGEKFAAIEAISCHYSGQQTQVIGAMDGMRRIVTAEVRAIKTTMLREQSARPSNSGFLRRWLTDDFFDLILWYEPGGDIHGFQLCYDKPRRERAFTWIADRGFTHAGIDTGEKDGAMNLAPVLTADEHFQAIMVREQFLNRAARIDEQVRLLVLSKIDEFAATSGPAE